MPNSENRPPPHTPFAQIYDRLTDDQLRDLHQLLEKHKHSPRSVFKQELETFLATLDPKLQEEYKKFESEMDRLEREKHERANSLSHDTQKIYAQLVNVLRDDSLSETEQVHLVQSMSSHLEPAVIEELTSNGIIIPGIHKV